MNTLGDKSTAHRHVRRIVNSNMKNSDLSKALQQISLWEVILEKHGLAGPATHKRNSNSTPIDGIWCSPRLSIERGGYFEYGAVCPSDHRCLWVDMTFMNAFGHNMALITKKKPRCLNCRDPRLVENYVHLYHQYAASHQLFQRVREFESRAPSMSRHAIIQEYEALDAIRCETTAFAERKCQKLRMGQVAFSPELNEIRLRIRAWKLLLARAKKQRTSSRLIERTLRKAKLPTSMRGMTVGELQDRLKEEHKTYYQTKGTPAELRLTALEELVVAKAAQGNMAQEKVLQVLCEREQQRASAKKIRFLQGKIHTGSITMVTTLDPNGQRLDITNQQEMEQAILISNHQKFRQSSHTPFYCSPLKEEFGFKGLSLAAQSTLAGLYKPHQDMDSRLLDVIAQWQIPANVQ
jgi:hypothetical protein